ncbi:hypothetical protein JD974_04255 [Chromobacterium haemolyticum]|uniref:Uncharacterized protein n=1 Tax=Chromobacterium haemolyticum TaxID=394935 RepID=A0ABS3GIG8_9NEIS|nr:hypothetical protein [Chromobacterium haemolyticum]MBK0413612.1 hypothetical protein [Chromobacterium haemolyticum]MBO0414714.1 hypothetical protein [Chromobacterium haemolyticum]MBO0497975.1 hypothetical protein [Chromobacterium haemolyticum]
MALRDLITNPATGRLSTSDSTLVGAFLASTLALLYATVTGQLSEWLFVGYLAAWVTQSQASKRAAIARDTLPTKPEETP